MEDFETGCHDIAALNATMFPKPFPTKMLKCCYNAKPTGAQKKTKEDICNKAIKCFEAGKAVIPI